MICVPAPASASADLSHGTAHAGGSRVRPAVRPTSLLLLLVAGLFAAAARPVSAQGARMSLEFRGGAAVPVGSFQEGGTLGDPVEAGASFGARFVYRTARTTAIQIGFSQDRSACETCPGADPYVATLWEVGARFGVGLGDVHSWILLGAVFGRVERGLVVDGRTTSALSPLDAGGTVGIGLDAPVGGALRIAPALRWVGLNTRFPGRDMLRIRYAVLDLGVMVGF